MTIVPKIEQPTPTIVNSKKEVIQVLKENRHIFKSFGVSEVALFGSFVREEASEDSDVDIVVNLHNFDYDNFYYLVQFCNQLFSNRSVDVIIESSLDETNGKTICRELEYV